MKRIISIVALLTLIGSFAQAADKKEYVTLPTIAGKTLHVRGTDNGLDIPEYKGKLVFLEFWGTHCPPCLASIPHYVDMIKKYKGKLAMLGIEVQGTPKAQLKAFADARGINYDVVSYHDAGRFVDYIAQRAGWKGSIPFLMILDPKGNVITMQVGMLPQKVLEKVIDDQLNKMSSSKPAAPKSTPVAKPAA